MQEVFNTPEYGFNPESWSNLRESLRLKLMFNDIPTEALKNYVSDDKPHTREGS